MIYPHSSSLYLHILLVTSLFLGMGCIENRPLAENVSSFTVEVSSEKGSEEAPLPFIDSVMDVDVRVSALSNLGGIYEELNGPVSLFVQPGVINQTGRTRVIVELEQGVGETSVQIKRTYGSTHICAHDGLREGATFTMGCSDRFHFEMPTVAQVQMTDDGSESPLEGAFVNISRGDMIVTGVYPDGFFLTDLDAEEVPDRPGDFDSIFVFSFSYPDGISIGDRLSSVSGTVQVFIGSTQLVFPSWIHSEINERDPSAMPDPVEITDAICAAATSGHVAGLCGHQTTNLDIESLEASLVSVHGARTPTRWVDCDFNRDGQIANYDPRCNERPLNPALETHCAEIDCKADCNQDKLCSELSGFYQYGQWSIALDGGNGPKINVVTREGVPEFDPVAEENRGIIIDVKGNLRHSLPARPRWIVLARNSDDLTIHRQE